MLASYFKYWGKAKPALGASAQWHPLVYHSLDVAATGRAYLLKQPRILRFFANTLGLPENVVLDWVVFLLAIHDLGKFSEAFQGQKPELFSQLHGRGPQYGYTVRHDSLGDWLWHKCLVGTLLKNEFKQSDRWWHGLAPLLRAVTGHHGQPPKLCAEGIGGHFSPSDEATTLEFVCEMRRLLLPLSSVEAWFSQELKPFIDRASLMSWWLAGLAVLADWLGSNTNFFPYCDPSREVSNYWPYAKKQAEKALLATGILPQPVAKEQKLTDLFPDLKGQTLTPLQQWCERVELKKGPQLFLLEDVTGAGKTEAAVTLAYRLMEIGEAEGTFIGLPTMATANAMFRRLRETAVRLYQPDARPSLLLAHGQRHLVPEFRDSVLPMDRAEADMEQGDETASARCAAWLADHNKKALLASAGVGTLDQGLLAVLHSKHQSLRLLGLMGKVLVVDEVHACDAYMQVVLECLLRFHAAMGGSAILLSATLPSGMKAKLAASFAEGCGWSLPPLSSQNYPLAAHLFSETAREVSLGTRPDVCRRVAVEYLHQEVDVAERIRAVLAQGRCVVWVRNTVADAIKAFNYFSEISAEKLSLFHARFAMGDRLDIESKMLDSFGPKSGPKDREGCLVIATQVVEQSLDVDFDFLVSDLAPIDRLIQRAGRLCRHVRNQFGERVQGSDLRGEPRMIVLGPQWTQAPKTNWYEENFRGGAAVYPHHGQLWLTARALQVGAFSMPEDARALIEGVYEETAQEEIPDGLRTKCNQAEGSEDASRAIGRQNSLKLKLGYKVGDFIDWWREGKTPTRLGEESIEVKLLCWNDERLSYWCDVDAEAADYSMVRVMSKWISSESMPENSGQRLALESFKARLPDQGKWNAWLVLAKDQAGCWVSNVVDAKGVSRCWNYSNRMGLQIVEKKSTGEDIS